MKDTLPISKIIHVDMDAFYASVEQMDNPELRGKPIAVGGNEIRGVITTASYEARSFGVHSAMPGVVAKRRCPDLIFVKPRFSRYKEISKQIRKIFYDYTDLVEPLALDEAFLDVTANKVNNSSATLIAEEIRQRIYMEVGLTASAGISINKFTAKIASDINKPNGQKTINPNEVISFLETLAIEKFFGVGKVTARKMNNHGIFSGKDLKEKDLSYLSKHFGKSGVHFYNIVRGIQHSTVQPNRIRKSISSESTFENDLIEMSEYENALFEIAQDLERSLNKMKIMGKTITLKIKYNDFTQQTRSKTIGYFVSKIDEFYPILLDILHKHPLEKPVRLLGIGFSNLNTEKPPEGSQRQLSLII